MQKHFLSYEFDPLGNSPEDGFNDPLKTMFGQASETVTREAFQNSIDAVLDPEKPVIVRVSLKILTRNEIPNADQLDKILEACAKNKSGKKHFENARKVLSSNEIPTLIISDFNTTGLTGGNNDKSGKYYNFFKSVGGHNKPAGSAGSYGYGKSTNIAFSEIDTFFATSNHAGRTENGVLFMGCIRVCSHVFDGVEKRGVGSFGMQAQQPVRDRTNIPSAFLLSHRKESRGTDIFIPAYKDHEGWKKNTIRSALKNFWLAIYNRKLIVEVENEIINCDSIERIMKAYFPNEDRTGNSWRREDPLPYYDAYVRGSKYFGDCVNLGRVEARLQAGNQQSATGYVACFRKNLMLIQHTSFRSIVPFTGVFVCADDNGNAILQKMEPPQHNKWDPHELHAQGENGRPLPECTNAEREYRSFLRDKIKDLLDTQLSSRIELSSVDKFISLAASKRQLGETAAAKENNEAEVRPMGTGVVRQERVKLEPQRPTSRLTDSGQASPSGEIIEIGPDCDSHPPGSGSGKSHGDATSKGQVGAAAAGPEPGPKSARIAKSTTRAFSLIKKGGLVTQVIVRTTPPRPNKVFTVHFQAGTDDKPVHLPVASVLPPATIDSARNVSGVVSDGDGVVRLEVTFVRNQPYALKVDLHEHI